MELLRNALIQQPHTCFQPEEFWGGIARSQLHWFKDFDSVMECNMREAKFEWFRGGKLNAAGMISR